MTPLEFTISCLGFVALVALIAAICTVMSRLDTLAVRVTLAEELLEKLIAKRVDETLSESARRLNAFEGRT